MRFTNLIFIFFFASILLQIRSSMASTLGGLRPSGGNCENSLEIQDLARFAVQEHNKNQNKMLEFGRVLKAEEQTVAGTMHHLTLEAIEAGKKMVFEAKVWVKPWLNFKELQDFKQQTTDESEPEPEAESAKPSFTSSDLGVKKDGHPQGWRSVPAHDPVVKDAANHAVTTLQQRSNSLFPYELQEIVHAKAEVIDDHANFDILMKVKRGDKEEKYKVEVHKNNHGDFLLNQIQQDEST